MKQQSISVATLSEIETTDMLYSYTSMFFVQQSYRIKPKFVLASPKVFNLTIFLYLSQSILHLRTEIGGNDVVCFHGRKKRNHL